MPKKKILIAEDNDSNYDLLREILQFDYEVVRAKDGRECVDMHKTEKPDLILMDIRMPNMNGFKATEMIRKSDKDTPIIAQSAHVFDDDRELSIISGCNRHLNKPIMIPELLSTIEEFLSD